MISSPAPPERSCVVNLDALEQAAGYIDTFFRSPGYPVEPHFFGLGGREFRNIVATRRVRHPPGERVND